VRGARGRRGVLPALALPPHEDRPAIIGGKRGTGGSSGVAFLQRALELEFFPELLDVRTRSAVTRACAGANPTSVPSGRRYRRGLVVTPRSSCSASRTALRSATWPSTCRPSSCARPPTGAGEIRTERHRGQELTTDDVLSLRALTSVVTSWTPCRRPRARHHDDAAGPHGRPPRRAGRVGPHAHGSRLAARGRRGRPSDRRRPAGADGDPCARTPSAPRSTRTRRPRARSPRRATAAASRSAGGARAGGTTPALGCA
jgi:hypothetical protein